MMTRTNRVYYLDDEPELLEVFQEYMAPHYSEVATFESGSDAKQVCDQAPPDVMVIDYRLAEMTGDDFVRELDEGVRTILVSGELDLNPVEHFDHFVPKPFRLSELKALIDSLL